jgi:hypothetical protein
MPQGGAPIALIVSIEGWKAMETAERCTRPWTEGLLERIKGEYREMPGLCLTPAQAARLWNLDPALASAALSRLANTGYLRRRIDGAYALSDGSRRACVRFLNP